jgi:16S rRNA (guanine966-N2)-methyltransferase
MRVISGKYGGRKLARFQDDRIRPTTDRVKESLFNILSDRVEAARVLDLFAGTGSLGIEALSRGAAHVTFVDHSASSLAIVKKNLSLLGVAASDFRLVKANAISFLGSGEHPFDLIFIDPPFTRKMADQVMQFVASAKWKGLPELAIETVKGEKILDSYGAWQRVRVNDYGDKALSLFQLQKD